MTRAANLTLLAFCLSLVLALWPTGSSEVQAQATSKTVSKLILTRRVDHLDAPAREPMIVEHPSGVQFVTGYRAARPTLWSSRDRGRTWTRVNVGPESAGAIGNSDVDLAVAPDGTVYFVTMGFNRATNEGTSIAVGATHDLGATWKWAVVSRARFDDRPWIEVTPDGAAHVIWNDGSGINYAISRDRGDSWTRRPRIHDKGGSSHFAVGPRGEMAVRIGPESASGNKFDAGVDLIAVSVDGGVTWTKRAAPGNREWSSITENKPGSIPRWVEPVAWDGQGHLYSIWTDPSGVWMARSPDRGESWKQWRVYETTDGAHFPYLVARGNGELAATWFTGTNETLHWHLGRIVVQQTDNPPHFIKSLALRLDSWAAPDRPGDPPTRDAAGEYLGLTFLRDGALVVVTPIQDPMIWRGGFSYWRFELR
ncbi:MAG TPA: sialidase family protein [Pyrinomonadaceae bacterium]|nr:sialidase family protein [Pyrinomonadaceae bacterium]